MNEQQISHSLNQVAEQAIPDNLDLWRAIQARVQRERRIGATPSARRICGRGALALIIALNVMLALAATAAAIYYKIIVIEPSQQISGLDEAMRKADFPVWVYGTGELVRVSDIAEGRDDYTILLEYKLADGRRFFIRELRSLPHLHVWDDADAVSVLDQGVEVNGEKAVLYLSKLTKVVNGESQVEWFGPSLHWHVEATDLTVYPRIDNIFTRDEIIAIARAMQRAKH